MNFSIRGQYFAALCGQWMTDRDILLKRREAIFSYDKEHQYKAAYQNEFVKKIYAEYFGTMNSEKAHEVMHLN